MHLYQRRPRPQAHTPQADFAQGTCYLVQQSALVFGRNRRTPSEWRVAISWARLGSRTYLFPATTKRHADFFCIPHGKCFLKRPHQDERDSYLCPRVEAVSQDALIELGILDHPTRLAIANWKRAQEGCS
ncbi:hypothetical protein [Lamprobacter modestohalophilus]|uniref:hypothetical protein n=1 Tax=Lamprobacter modestohalophilus TaxID=1064514 RepID=UPI0019088934|nr:hypothetical protein [Lamprobacter modestohalophilus]